MLTHLSRMVPKKEETYENQTLMVIKVYTSENMI